MRRTNLRSVVVAALALLAGGVGMAQTPKPPFKFSELPPPGSDAAAVGGSLYDSFTAPGAPPSGASAAVAPADLFDKAAAALSGPEGRPADPAEAAYWLKRAILAAPDETGRRRAWALRELGLVLYGRGDAKAHAAARSLWEIAAAWRNPAALCDLGRLAEAGDDTTTPDAKVAVVWYERALRAGCAPAAGALARLRR